MDAYYTDDWLTIYQGDVRTVLPELASDSVDCIVTSPPYWGLRDYGETDQLGLERTPEEYVGNLVAVFRELRRVLKPSGTCWLNLGDSYIANPGSGQARGESTFSPKDGTYSASDEGRGGKGWSGLPGKNLVGIPWRVAFALQADGWYLRSDIIWAKPNPMPESVTDRPTKAHEYLFLLTKSARYYFDADAVREAYSEKTWFYDHVEPVKAAGTAGNNNGTGKSTLGVEAANGKGGRNLRSVWTIATRPYPGAHFAVFPPELPERCIKAGSSERGVCPECGAPWERVVEVSGETLRELGNRTGGQHGYAEAFGDTPQGLHHKGGHGDNSHRVRQSTGWLEPCGHLVANPVPAVILDPFAGSGTVGMVANRLSRKAILIDLNAEYLKQIMKRNAQTPLGV
jgi:DNA modification methylase